MRQVKTIFIIPGFRQYPTRRSYKKVARMLKKQGYTPIPVTIPWRENSIPENTQYFLEEYKKVKTKKKYILGFSYGALIAFLASTKTRVNGLILCSLSPYIKGDVPKFTLLAKKVRAKQTFMLYGEEEAATLIKRVKKAFDKISSSDKYLASVQNAHHTIANKKYLHMITQAAKVLN